LIPSEHVRLEHISIQLDAGASAPKQSAKTKAFQTRFDTLHNRFLKKGNQHKETFIRFIIVNWKEKRIRCYYIVDFL